MEETISNIKKLHPRNNGGRRFFRPVEDMGKRNKWWSVYILELWYLPESCKLIMRHYLRSLLLQNFDCLTCRLLACLDHIDYWTSNMSSGHAWDEMELYFSTVAAPRIFFRVFITKLEYNITNNNNNNTWILRYRRIWYAIIIILFILSKRWIIQYK